MKVSYRFLKAKKFVLVVVTLSLISALAGCQGFGQNTQEIVQERLYEKYGEEFVVTYIGDRYNTGSATLFCHPFTDESINFTAIYNYSTEELKDDFIDRKMAVELDKDISDTLKKNGFDGTSISIFYASKLDDVSGEENLEEFIVNSKTKELYIYLAMEVTCVENETDAQNWLNAIKMISDRYHNIDLLVSTFWLDKEDYAECSQALKIRTDVNDEWFEKYHVISNINVKVESQVINTNANDIIKTLMR